MTQGVNHSTVIVPRNPHGGPWWEGHRTWYGVSESIHKPSAPKWSHRTVFKQLCLSSLGIETRAIIHHNQKDTPQNTIAYTIRETHTSQRGRCPRAKCQLMIPRSSVHAKTQPRQVLRRLHGRGPPTARIFPLSLTASAVLDNVLSDLL